MGLRIFAAAVVVLSASLAARADIVTENYTFTGTAVLLNDPALGTTSTSFPEFDPSLGTLNSITFALSGKATFSGTDLSFAEFTTVTSASDVNGEIASGTGFGAAGDTFDVSAGTTFFNGLSIFEGTGTQGLVLDFLFSGAGTVTADRISGTLTYNFTPAGTTPEPTIAATPEPSTVALLLTGLVGVAGVMRKRLA